MKQTIRYSTFETNSSSMHSLVVTKSPKKYSARDLALGYDQDDLENGKPFYLWGWASEEDMTYERWPFRILSTPLEKLQYYCAYTLQNYSARPNKKAIKDVTAFVMRQTGIKKAKDVILYQRFRENSKNKFYGVVAFNDTGESPMEFIKKNKINWEDFILNPKYIVIVDGDEEQNFKSLVNSGVVNTDNFEDISSGVDFWNNAHKSIYTYWFTASYAEGAIKELLARITNKTKSIDINILEQEDVARYCLRSDVVTTLIKRIRTDYPSVKVNLIVSNDKPIDISSIDTSIFDDVQKIKYNVM